MIGHTLPTERDPRDSAFNPSTRHLLASLAKRRSGQSEANTNQDSKRPKPINDKDTDKTNDKDINDDNNKDNTTKDKDNNSQPLTAGGKNKDDMTKDKNNDNQPLMTDDKDKDKDTN